MTSCDRLRRDAAGLAALPAGDPDGEEARAHARGCPGCARALLEAERLQAAMADAAAPSPFGPDAGAGASRAITSELRQEARRRALAAGVAAGVAFALCVALARHRSPAAQDWLAALALALAGLASAAGSASRRWALLAVAAAPALALALALATGEPGEVHPGIGAHCLATELACAALVVAAAWFALRRGTSSLGLRAATAAAGAGALAGLAALQLTCPAHTARPHLLSSHVAGVLLALSAAALWRLAADRSAPR